MKYFDIYGNTINLNIKQKEKIKTKFGGFMSIISFLSIITIIWFEGKDIIYKINPRISKETHLTENYTQINFSSDEFPIAIGLVDDFENILEIENLFEIEINHFSYIINENKTSNTLYGVYDNIQKLNYTKCKYRDFRGKIRRDKYESLKLFNYLCSNYTDISLEGFWDENKGYYLGIKIKKCNSRKNKNCRSENEIDDFIKEKMALFYFIYMIPNFDFLNYESPISYKLLKEYKYLATNLKKSYHFGLQKNEIITDSGWFFKEDNHNLYYNIEDLGSDVMNYERNDNVIIDLYISSINSKIEITRKYVKLSNILGIIGGLIKIYSTVFLFLNKFFSQIKFFEIIINEIFFVPEDFKKTNLVDDSKLIEKDFKNRDGLKSNSEKIISDNFRIVDKNSFHYSSGMKIKNRKFVNKSESLEMFYSDLMINKENKENFNYSSKFSLNISHRSNDFISEKSKKESNYNLNNGNFRIDLILENLKKKKRKKSHFKISWIDSINLGKMKVFKMKTYSQDYLKKYKILIHGQEKISQYLNLEKIIQKFENIEIIKQILFEKYQKDFLDVICIPTLDLNNPYPKKEVKNAYEKIKNKDINLKEKIYYQRSLFSDENIKKYIKLLENYENNTNEKIDEKMIKILIE